MHTHRYCSFHCKTNRQKLGHDQRCFLGSPWQTGCELRYGVFQYPACTWFVYAEADASCVSIHPEVWAGTAPAWPETLPQALKRYERGVKVSLQASNITTTTAAAQDPVPTQPHAMRVAAANLVAAAPKAMTANGCLVRDTLRHTLSKCLAVGYCSLAAKHSRSLLWQACDYSSRHDAPASLPRSRPSFKGCCSLLLGKHPAKIMAGSPADPMEGV